MNEEKCFNCGKRHDSDVFLGFCSKKCLEAWSNKYWPEERGKTTESKENAKK